MDCSPGSYGLPGRRRLQKPGARPRPECGRLAGQSHYPVACSTFTGTGSSRAPPGRPRGRPLSPHAPRRQRHFLVSGVFRGGVFHRLLLPLLPLWFEELRIPKRRFSGSNKGGGCVTARPHGCYNPPPFDGPVAQRLVQGTHNPLVLGSNPSGPS